MQTKTAKTRATHTTRKRAANLAQSRTSAKIRTKTRTAIIWDYGKPVGLLVYVNHRLSEIYDVKLAKR